METGGNHLPAAVWEKVAASIETDGAMRAIMEAAHMGIVIIHRDSHVIVEANRLALELIGVAKNDLIGRRCHQFICPTEVGRCPITDLGQSVDRSERILTTPRGERLPILKSVSECRVGGVNYLVECFLDLTDRKRVEETLDRMRHQHDQILESIEEGVVSFDLEGKVTFLNAAAETLLGFASGELLGQPWQLAFHRGGVSGQASADAACPILDVARTGRSLHLCTFFASRPGTLLPVEVVAAPLRHGSRTTGVVMVFQDCTALRATEEQLRQSDLRFQRMVESLTSYIFTVRLEGGKPVQTSHGAGCQTVTGYSPEDFHEDPLLWIKMVHPEDRDEVRAHAQNVLAGRTIKPVEHRLLHKCGETRWVRNTPVVNRGPDGVITQYAGLVVDITDRKRVSEQILQMNAELERRVRERTIQLQTANEQLERLARELAEARQLESRTGFEIQKTLLLGTPPRKLGWVKVAAATIPTLGIDGDFYDFFVHRRTTFDLLFGDVMGKGIPAALVGAAAKSQFQRSLLRLAAQRLPGQLPALEEVVGRVHAEMTPNLEKLERFLSLHFARFDQRRRGLELVNCGHTYPLHRHGPTRACSVIETGQAPIGLNARETYRPTFVPFLAGDVFLFYSDGVTDSRSPDGEFFGVPRLQKMLEEYDTAEETLQGFIDRVVATVLAFSKEVEPSDDLSLLAVAITRGGTGIVSAVKA